MIYFTSEITTLKPREVLATSKPGKRRQCGRLRKRRKRKWNQPASLRS